MKKKVLSLFIALALIVTLLPAGAFASDPGSVEWAGAMNMNAENNQVSEASVPLSPETTALKWQYALNTVSDCWGAYYAGQTVIADDYLYATGGGHLHKISTADGTAVSASVNAGSAAFYYDYLCCGGGMIFVATTGSITAYDLSDLSTKWTVSANYGYYHPVQYLAVGEMAYIYCNGFVYKASDGTAVTLKNKDEEALAATFNWSSGAVVDGYFYVASTTAVYAINMSTWTASDSWEYAASATLAPGVAYDDTTGRIYFGSYTSSNIYSAKIDTGTHGFDTAEGSKIEAAVSQPTCCTPVIYNGRVYLAGQSGKIDVLNSETLEMIYSAAGSGTKIQDNPILSTAGAAADNNYTVHLCFQNYNGDIFILEDNSNITSGSVVKIAEGSNPTNVTWPCSYEQIAIDDEGNIYCYNESGYLFCYTETSAYLTALTPSKSELSTSFAAGMESYELVIPAGETSVSLAVTPCEGGSVMVGTDAADLEELVLTEGSGSVDVDSITTTATTFYIKAVCGSDSRIYSVSIRQKNSETGIHVVTSTSNNITSGTEAIAATGNLYTVTTMSGIRVWLGLQDANASFGSWTILDGTALNLTTTTRTNTYDDLVYQKRIFSSSFKEGQILASVTVTAEDGATTQTYYFALSCEDEFVKATENVYVTIADEGSFVTGTDADSTLLANAPVMVTDLNTDGNFNVDETLYAAHEAYYSGGAAAGYGSSETQWGLSLTKLWGDTSSCYGYWVNNASAWSLEDSVESGDYVTAFVYKDQTSWSDTYTAFSARSYSATAGNPVTLTLNAYTYNPSTYGYDEGAYTEGASISVVGTSISGVTDENGQVTLTLPSAGTYTLTATETDGSIVPAACKVAVAAPTQTITVNFTLLGNTVHGTDGTAHTYKDGNLETWIASTSISIEDGSTVGDVFKTVLDANGYTYEDLESNYISDITTPNGVTLSERSNGPNSGWMYLVNGVVPLVGVNDYVLSNGNSVIFFYTDDYTNEIGSEQWITPTEPSSSNEAIAPAVTAHNGKAEASVDSEAIKSALSENSGKVVIAPKITGSAESVSISVSTSSIKEIAENSSGTLSVETDCGNVSFTNDILDSISEQADGEDVQISIETKSAEDVDLPETELENAVIVEIGISSGSNNITTFDGGDLSVSVPVTGEYSAGETYKVIVISSDGTAETLIGRVVVNEGKAFVEVSVSHLSTFVVTDTQAASFDDVNTAAWYYDAVQYTSLNSIMTGVSKTDFAPNMEISRAMLVTVLYRLDGSPEATGNISFSDVEEDAWYKDAVIWASKNGIVKGRGDGTFGTNDSIKREEAAVILYRYALLRNMNTSKAAELSQYSDAGALSSWSQDAMRWANANRLITGTTANTLSPKGSMTRAQAATILMRFSEYPESTAQDTVSETAEATAAYMLKTVSTPQVGSIGGEWAVIGLVASGYDVPQTWLDNYYTTVEEYVTDRNGVLSNTKYTEYSRVILALTIIGKAADNVGTYDLTTYLADFENVVRQGLNGSIWALLALDSGNYDIPENSEVNVQATREMYIDEVLSNQLTSGGFSLTGQAPADVDITAMALCALSQYQSRSDVSSAVEKAIAYLSGKQGESGDYSSCCESTAQVIIALCSLGISADDSRFVKNGCTLTDGLTCYYAGNGQFRHISDGNVNQMATEQALLALAALKRAENGESSIYNISTAE